MKNSISCSSLAAILILFGSCETFGQFGGIPGRVQQALQNSQMQPRAATPSPQPRQTGASPQAARKTGQVTADRKEAAAQVVDRYALIVAVREYPNAAQLPSLPGTNLDAVRLAGVLEQGGFSKGNVVVVCDDAADVTLRPTRANIVREFRELVQRATERSLVSMFVTCHGVSLADASYICPGDATDMALTDAKKAGDELIAVKDLATQLSKECKAAHKLLVVDACRDTSNDRTKGYVKNVEALEEPADGLWLLSSCSEGQYSWMSDRIREGERHALFSHFIARGLAGDADLLGDNDGEVGLFELYTYAFVKTRDAAVEIQEKQTPELFGLASPFSVVRTGNFVSRRKLTTSDPQLEAARSAEQLADDVVVNLRSADREYRDTVSAPDVNEETVSQSSQILHRYLCHLMGNRIRCALEFDEDCRLAWVAKGLCYRTCGLYGDALSSFEKGGERFSLFVKARPDSIQHYVAYDPQQNRIWRDEHGNPVPRIQKAQGRALGSAMLYEHPGDDKPKYSVQRQKKVRISKIQDQWLYVDAVDDTKLAEGGWIHRDEVHWFPEAVDVYTPASPMRSWGGGGAANRLDYASDNLNALSEQLAQPAMAIEQLAAPLRDVAETIRTPGRIIDVLNGIPFMPYIPNYADVAAGWVELPAAYIDTAARYARIPSNYVAIAGGYASIPGNYARIAQQWSGLADTYYAGHQREEKVEESRKNLQDAGKLERVVERPVLILEISLPKRKRQASAG